MAGKRCGSTCGLLSIFLLRSIAAKTNDLHICKGGKSPAKGNTCKIIAYDPHPIGESISSPTDPYVDNFQKYHQRDLALIKQLGANMVKLRPWQYGADHSKFLSLCTENTLQVMATFSIYAYIVDLKSNGQARQDFLSFLDALKPDNKTVVAVTVDRWPLLNSDPKAITQYFELMSILKREATDRGLTFVLPLNLDPDRLDPDHENYPSEETGLTDPLAPFKNMAGRSDEQ
jgi:hypothetical protein